jgi:branched-chain amino acid transport system permease protein
MAYTIANVLSLGSLYALIALGVALIYGILQLVNFAHGALIMIAAYSTLLWEGAGTLWLVVATLAVGAVAALLTERIAFRPVRGADPTTLLVTSFAVGFLIQNLVILILGARPKAIGILGSLNDPLTVLGADSTGLAVCIVVTTLVVLAAVAAFLSRTAVGIQMQAAAEDFRMARLCGVRANRVIAVAFALSGLLAAIVAVLLVAQNGTLEPNMGLTPVLIGFVATVIGGLGGLSSAVLGGYLLGLITVCLQTYLPESLRPYRDAMVFGAVIALLALRPQGLIPNRALEERV